MKHTIRNHELISKKTAEGLLPIVQELKEIQTEIVGAPGDFRKIINFDVKHIIEGIGVISEATPYLMRTINYDKKSARSVRTAAKHIDVRLKAALNNLRSVTSNLHTEGYEELAKEHVRQTVKHLQIAYSLLDTMTELESKII